MLKLTFQILTRVNRVYHVRTPSYLLDDPESSVLTLTSQRPPSCTDANVSSPEFEAHSALAQDRDGHAGFRLVLTVIKCGAPGSDAGSKGPPKHEKEC